MVKLLGIQVLSLNLKARDASTPTGELRYRYQLDDEPLISTDDFGLDKTGGTIRAHRGAASLYGLCG